MREVTLTEPVYVDPTATIRSAAVTMREHMVGSVLVAFEEAHRLGIVTEQDITRALADGADPDEVWAADVMTDPLTVAAIHEDIGDVLQRMIEEGIRHVPVIEGSQVLGVVSLFDLVVARLLKDYP